jgi:hypothetical protein
MIHAGNKPGNVRLVFGGNMGTKTVKTKWYKYHQNNSGGRFRPPAITVYVEAMSPSQADERAETLGLYFDGSGDCKCCGSRWSGAVDWDSQEEEPPLEQADELYAAWAERDEVLEAIKIGLSDKEPTSMVLK